MNYSFRKKNKIVKYIVIHYTGMKNLNLAYQKLSHNRSNVSSHYLISRNGLIFNFVCPRYKAWHAGKSKWRNDTNINEYSIGIHMIFYGFSIVFEYTIINITSMFAELPDGKFGRTNFQFLRFPRQSSSVNLTPGSAEFFLQMFSFFDLEHAKTHV